MKKTSAPPRERRAVERLMNLVMTLGSSEHGLTRAQIFELIPDYLLTENDASRLRMFERDKRDVLALGFPLVLETDPWDDTLSRYRLDPAKYAAHDFQPDSTEYALLVLASRSWDLARTSGPALRARAKLAALGGLSQNSDMDPTRHVPHGRLETSPVLGPILTAVTNRVRLTFRYRTAGASEAKERRVEPWVAGLYAGHWYVVGYDLDRQEQRTFRVSRIESYPRFGGKSGTTCPDGLTVTDAIRRVSQDEYGRTVIAIAPYKLLDLRDRTGLDPVTGELCIPEASRWHTVSLVLSSVRWAQLITPNTWREDIAGVLSRIADQHEQLVDSQWRDTTRARPRPTLRVPTTGVDQVSRLASEVAYRGGAARGYG
ncbi:helix-turn-helix transcriptional regulator [Devriesea agamarum]|uniref:helix-turn-helix transcriptional regulator n=1 Tax=Devriesea agamarum TaxID=472569 RepID=UPI00071C2C92|nr:WYL domain-containing protein [Devriesea agamarum]